MTHKLIVALAILLIGILSSCSSNSNIDELLETVPKNTQFIAVFDVTSLIQKAKIRNVDGKLTFPEELQTHLSDNAKKLFTQNLGLDFSHAVAFGLDENVLFTLKINDSEIFKKSTENAGEKWLTENEITYNNNRTIFFTENQVWFSQKKISASEIASLINLKEKESIISIVKKLEKNIDFDKDIAILAQIEELTSAADNYMDTNEALVASMIPGIISGDAKYIIGYAEFTDKKLESTLNLYNGKGEIAGSNIELGEIDTELMEKLLNNQSVIAAISLPQPAVKTLAGKLGFIAQQEHSAINSILKKIDGTMAVGIGVDDNEISAFVSTTDPAAAADIKSQISDILPIDIRLETHGKQIFCNKTETNKLQKAIADKFKGYNVALYTTNRQNDVKIFIGFKTKKQELKIIAETDFAKNISKFI